MTDALDNAIAGILSALAVGLPVMIGGLRQVVPLVTRFVTATERLAEETGAIRRRLDSADYVRLTPGPLVDAPAGLADNDDSGDRATWPPGRLATPIPVG